MSRGPDCRVSGGHVPQPGPCGPPALQPDLLHHAGGPGLQGGRGGEVQEHAGGAQQGAPAARSQSR